MRYGPCGPVHLLFSAVLIVFFFPLSANSQNPDWSRYHSTAETHALLHEWASAYPDLTNLYSIGETVRGTPLMVLEITNKETGPGSEKPGYYYDGNIHAGELTGAEVALYFAWTMLSRYGKDPATTRLLDTRVLYIRPKFNPDGADIALAPPYPSLRSTPRPYDQDGDGLLDEDGATDLNRDGNVTEMRVRNAEGLWKISSDDSRLMVRREANELGGVYYDIYAEGLDADNDGVFNEDGIGGIDMNRNFPRNWGMEFEQRGAGPFPLSEPETLATLEFLNAHRNITGVFHGHTSGGFLFRLPSTSAWDGFDPSDQDLILELSNKYETTTGQRAIPSYTDPLVHRHGTLISWSYWDFGVVAFVPEFWRGPGEDYDRNGEISGLERLRWNDEELSGEGFVNWTAYDHPQLGDVEIGGWKHRFVSQNPPPHLLPNEIKLYVPWMLWLAEISPRVVIRGVEIVPAEVQNEFNVTVTVENEGYLPTYITRRALESQIATPVRIVIELENAELTEGKERVDVGHLNGTRIGTASKDQRSGSAHPSRKTIEYRIRRTGELPMLAIIVTSEKGGVARLKLAL